MHVVRFHSAIQQVPTKPLMNWPVLCSMVESQCLIRHSENPTYGTAIHKIQNNKISNDSSLPVTTDSGRPIWKMIWSPFSRMLHAD